MKEINLESILSIKSVMPNSGSAGYLGYWNYLVNGEDNCEEGEKFEELDPSGRYGRVGLVYTSITTHIFLCSNERSFHMIMVFVCIFACI